MTKKKMIREIGNYIAYSITAGTGLALWIVIPTFSGEPDAWGSGIYYKVGIPLLMVECILFGYLIPERWWQWGLTATLSQAVFMIIKWPTSDLLPPALMFLVLLSIPYLVGGFIGVQFLKKLGKGKHRGKRIS